MHEARLRTGQWIAGVASAFVIVSYLTPWLDLGLFKQTGLELLSLALQGSASATGRNGPRIIRDLQELSGAIFLVAGVPLACHVGSLVLALRARSKAVRWLLLMATLLPLVVWTGLVTLGVMLLSRRGGIEGAAVSFAVRGVANLMGVGVYLCALAMLTSWIGTLVMLRADVAPLPPPVATSPHTPASQPVLPPPEPSHSTGAGFEFAPTMMATPVAQTTTTRSSAEPSARPRWLVFVAVAVLAVAGGVAGFALTRGPSATPDASGASNASPATTQSVPSIPTPRPPATPIPTHVPPVAALPTPAPPVAPLPTPAPTTPSMIPSATAESLERIPPIAVVASSALGGRDPHPAEHAFDANPRTAWNESAPGPGTGEWIEATFATPRRVRRVTLATGWDFVSPRVGDLFSQNSHLRRLRLVYSDGGSDTRDVADEQRSITIATDHTTSSIRVVADDVYPGTRWQDLCISDITIEASPAR